ncbi:MAG: DUF6687 family protein [Roseiflexaceae bacterium]
MHFELFHHGLLGRHDIVAVDMLHYSGLWGVCFSHHLPTNNHPRYAADTTVEGLLRFLADTIGSGDDAAFRAWSDYTITTHHIDADALIPIWSLLNPEAALERRDLLERVARCGDFFIYTDDTSAQLNFIVEALQMRLRADIERADRVLDNDLTRRCFDWLLPRWGALLDDPSGGADLWQPLMRELLADLDYLAAPGRVTELWDRHASLVEADRAIDAHALNSVCRNDLLITWRSDTPMRQIAVRPAIGWYDLQSLPHRPRYDLGALAERLNVAELAAGHDPTWLHDPGPARIRAESSGLSHSHVLDVVKDWIDAAPEACVPLAYRADVQQVFRHAPRHAIYTSHVRFADAPEIGFVPGAPYGGLYLVPGFRLQIVGHGSDIRGDMFPIPCDLGAQHDAPLQFAVSDDFYWNRRTPQPLELRITYEDRGAGRFWVEYDTWRDPFQRSAPVALDGDGATHIATFRLDDARLGNSQDWADLRLVRAPGTAIGIRELVLRKF